MNMNKKELMVQIKDETGLPLPTIDSVLSSLFLRIEVNLVYGGKITIQDFGTFKVDDLLFTPVFEFTARIKKAVQEEGVKC
jgi:nucleoid DNA-binding protein